MPTVVVTGSRTWTNGAIIREVLSALPRSTRVAHGGCPKGVDALADTAARAFGLPVDVYAVDHDKDGPWPAAGPRRNLRMLEEAKPDLVLAFSSTESGSMTKGTASCVKFARTKNIPTLVLTGEGDLGLVRTMFALAKLQPDPTFTWVVKKLEETAKAPLMFGGTLEGVDARCWALIESHYEQCGIAGEQLTDRHRAFLAKCFPKVPSSASLVPLIASQIVGDNLRASAIVEHYQKFLWWLPSSAKT